MRKLGNNTGELKILKIGGSVITNKSKDVIEEENGAEIRRVSREISSDPENLILVHGVGSFGHPQVEKYNLKVEKNNIKGVIETHLACVKLNYLFCKALFKEGIHPAPVCPFSALRLTPSLEFDIHFISNLVRKGITPVFHGDMVYDEVNDCFEVVSGDTIVVELAKSMDIKKIGYATDVEGLIISDGIMDEVLIDDELIAHLGSAQSKSDVTGGMKGKVESMLKLKTGSEALIFSGLVEGNIRNFLKGKKVGTRLKRD